MDDPAPHISIVIPAYNEADVIGSILDQITALALDTEVIVVNDGSTDNTGEIARSRTGVRVIDHPYNIGNGAAVKTGIWAARGEIIVMMDSDGQHQPKDIPRLVAGIGPYDMVVGARSNDSNTELHRNLANKMYNALASYIVNRPIPDLTSGFRAIRASIAKRFVYLLPNGFSYPTTLTISLFRAGHSVHYEAIDTLPRLSSSGIHLVRDGLGFILIMLRIGTMFAPLRIFLPLSIILFGVGSGYGAWLLIWSSRFSNMAVLLILTGIMVFMMGLISEQIALLRMAQAAYYHYNNQNKG